MQDPHPLANEVGLTVTRLIEDTVFGSLVFIVQDSRIVQLERNEKYQFPAPRKSPAADPNRAAANSKGKLSALAAALKGLQFGQVVVKLQDGRIVQIDRTEKRRVPDLTGVSGDGI